MSEHNADAVVERMAQAAFDEIENTPGSTPLDWRDLHESKREHYRRIMRAALATGKSGDRLPGGLVVMEDMAAKLMAGAIADNERARREIEKVRASMKCGARRAEKRFRL